MKCLFALLSALLSLSSFAQTTEFLGNVSLNNKSKVYKVVTVPGCPEKYVPPTGATKSTITYETKLKNGQTDIKIESFTEVPDTGLNVDANKTVKIPIFPNANGKANFYIDEKDKTTLYVNYWLNDSQTLPANTIIQEYSAKFDCNGNANMIPKSAPAKLAEATKYNLWKVYPGRPETQATWFKISDQIIVYEADGTTIDYYLVNRYDRNAKYLLELPNRGTITYNSRSLDFGALTIPFKYRYGYNKGDIKVKSDVIAGFNIGLYGGYKLTNYKLKNRSGTYLNNTFSSLRVGPFINISAATLDSVTTTAGKEPMAKDDKHNIAVLSPGVGIMLDVNGVQFGVYGGWDFGMGSEARNWNYNKKFWLGFGIGYKLTDLFAKKD
jgi:hypothetical protein